MVKKGNIMKNILRSPLFKRYILSYIVVFSIPFLVLLTVIQLVYINNVREELTAANENYLSQSDILLNEQLNEMRQVGNLINLSPDFTTMSALRSNRYEEYRDQIQIYEQSTRAVEAIYVVINQSSIAFSSNGVMSTEALVNHSSSLNVHEKDRLVENVENPTENLSVYTLNAHTRENDPWQNNSIIYTMPLGDRYNPYGSTIFVMNTTALQENMEAISERDEGMTFLMDEENDIVLSSSMYPKLNREALTGAVSQVQQEETIEIEGTNYLSSHITSDGLGWTFVTLIDTNRFYQPLYEIVLIFIIGAIVLVILGLALSYYFANKHYQPVKTLTNVFDDEISSSMDEWNYLERNINKTYSEIKLLNSLMDEQIPIIKNATLLELIEGKYENVEEFTHQIKEGDITFPFSYYSMLIIEFGSRSVEKEHIIDIEKVSQELNKRSTEGKFHLEATVPYLRNNQIFIVVNLSVDSISIWEEVITAIQDVIKNQEITKNKWLKIGVGSTYDTWKKTKNAYIEASSAIEIINKKTKRVNQVLFFEDINKSESEDSHSEAIYYPKEKTMLLLQSLKQGNIKTAEETVQELFSTIEKENNQEYEIATQAIIAYLFNEVIQTANELNLDQNSKLLLDLSSFSDIEHAQRLLTMLVGKVCEEVKEKQESESSEIEQRVVDYLYSHYDSPSLSLEMIASENNVSISYASKLVKDETGESFSNLLQSLRMNKFKGLLMSTNKPIKELVLEVGYYDVSNFTRKFRQENGLTPGQYRKKMRKKTYSNAIP